MPVKNQSQIPIKDLSGGLNVRDSANQIEDKQLTKCDGWNFDGNKLVTSKGMTQKHELSTTLGAIKGLFKVDDDLYYSVHGGILYKNGVEIQETIFLDVDSVIDSTTYSIDIKGVSSSYTSGVDATLQEILDGLQADIETNVTNISIIQDAGTVQALDGSSTITSQTGLYITSTDGVALLPENNSNVSFVESDTIPDRYYNMWHYAGKIFLASRSKDGTSDDNLIVYHNGLIRFFGSVDLRGTVVAVYENRIFTNGKEGFYNVLYYSVAEDTLDEYNMFNFDVYPAGVQRVGAGYDITSFANVDTNFFIGTEQEVHQITGTAIDDVDTGSFSFQIDKIANTGVTNQYVFTEVEQEVIYFDINNNVRRLSYEENLSTLRDTRISDEIQPKLDALSKTQTQATAYYKYPNYKIFLKDGSTNNNVCFTYNVYNKSWLTESYKDASVSHKGLLGSNYDGRVYKDEDGVALLDGPIVGEAISKAYDGGDYVNFKRFVELEITGLISSDFSLYLDIYIDGGLIKTVEINKTIASISSISNNFVGENSISGGPEVTELTRFTERIAFYKDGHALQFGLRYNGNGTIEVHNVNIGLKGNRSWGIIK